MLRLEFDVVLTSTQLLFLDAAPFLVEHFEFVFFIVLFLQMPNILCSFSCFGDLPRRPLFLLLEHAYAVLESLHIALDLLADCARLVISQVLRLDINHHVVELVRAELVAARHVQLISYR